jgi:uncharacterized surface protein with fasciclin (FAS1) repeats
MVLSLAASANSAQTSDLAENAREDGRLSTFLAAATAAGMVETLKADGPLTVFAPTDEAFAALPEGALASLLEPANRERLRRLVAHHIVDGRVTSEDLLPSPRAVTVAGTSLAFGLRVGDANVVQADISCGNGVIHVIDRVLVPPQSPRPGESVAADLIRSAIERGAPMFNDGDHAGCASLYERTARDLAATTGALGELQSQDVASVVAALPVEPDERAWALRAVFDRVLADEVFVPRVEAPMPEGFPAPGRVGRVTEKTYPAYRAARAEGANTFWTLFDHIKKNDVAMTAPVEMTMEPTGQDGLRMLDQAFLYERPTLGAAGVLGKVSVLDLPARTVLSIGMRGNPSTADVARARAALEARLAKDGLERAGPFRMMAYNSPMVPAAQRFWELQIPFTRGAGK